MTLTAREQAAEQDLYKKVTLEVHQWLLKNQENMRIKDQKIRAKFKPQETEYLKISLEGLRGKCYHMIQQKNDTRQSVIDI